MRNEKRMYFVCWRNEKNPHTGEPISETRRTRYTSTFCAKRARMQRSSSSNYSKNFRCKEDNSKHTQLTHDGNDEEVERWEKRAEEEEVKKKSYVVCNIHSWVFGICGCAGRAYLMLEWCISETRPIFIIKIVNKWRNICHFSTYITSVGSAHSSFYLPIQPS